MGRGAREGREALAERLSAIPGVVAARAADSLPSLRDGRMVSLEIAGRPPASPTDRPWAVATAVDAAFLSTLDVPLIDGRWFTRDDSSREPTVALLSRAAAAKYGPVTEMKITQPDFAPAN